jgi:F0F1-type ATP synthase membrane subunit b/b'
VKSRAAWIVLLVCLAGLAWLVKPEGTKLGVPVFVWLALNLTIFLYVLARLVGRPMAGFLDARQQSIATELEQAKEKLAEAERLKAEVLARLDSVEAEVATIRERAEDAGRAEAERIAEQTERDQERFLRRVEEEIGRRQAETREALARETAALTAQLARDVLVSGMTDADRARLFEQSVAALRSVEE